MNTPFDIWTVGHSGHSAGEFLELLRAHRIEAVADVRRFPVSRRFPHFSQLELFKSLAKSGIAYSPYPELGGRRRALPDSINTRWHNESFRGFADYMDTANFHNGIGRLLEMAASRRTAILCAEAIWWRCHRALIADYLKAHGLRVIHILSCSRTQEHPFTSAARVADGHLTYAPEAVLELAHH
jgi:uncharacterized protein (DUF488 family)